MQLKKYWQILAKVFKKITIFPFLLLLFFYRNCISPFLPNACRFTPTCSRYAIEAFQKRGLFVGFYLTVWRILRCNPWGGHGYDPVPESRRKIKNRGQQQ
ncbi:MAG: membrane protein insertion efficiency factor YidD [Rikenellaceae bacterium]